MAKNDNLCRLKNTVMFLALMLVLTNISYAQNVYKLDESINNNTIIGEENNQNSEITEYDARVIALMNFRGTLYESNIKYENEKLIYDIIIKVNNNNYINVEVDSSGDIISYNSLKSYNL